MMTDQLSLDDHPIKPLSRARYSCSAKRFLPNLIHCIKKYIIFANDTLYILMCTAGQSVAQPLRHSFLLF